MKTDNSKNIYTLTILTLLLVFISGCQLNSIPLSASYTVVYSSSDPNGRGVYIADDKGESRIRLISVTGNDGYPDISPDGERLAFYGKYDKRKTWSIHTVNIDGSNLQRLTHENEVWDSAPAWSPDGKTIAFGREYNDFQKRWQEEVWLMNADGTNQRKIEALEGRAPYFLDDSRILYHSKTGPSQICIANIDGTNIIKLTNNDANDWSPKVSPDGTKIAFISNRDGNQEVYTMNIDGSNQRRITFNSEDDWGPAWSVNGEKLFFNSKNSEGFRYIYKVNIDGSSIEKVLNNGSQVASVKNINKRSLEKLISRYDKAQ